MNLIISFKCKHPKRYLKHCPGLLETEKRTGKRGFLKYRLLWKLPCPKSTPQLLYDYSSRANTNLRSLPPKLGGLQAEVADYASLLEKVTNPGLWLEGASSCIQHLSGARGCALWLGRVTVQAPLSGKAVICAL